MVWSLVVFALLSSWHMSYGRELNAHSSHLIRNVLPRNEFNDANLVSMLYNLRQNDVNPATEAEDLKMSERSNSYPMFLEDREPIFLLRDREELTNEQIESEAEELADLQNLERESSLEKEEADLSTQERYILQKRLKMKGMGLLGSSKPKGLSGSSRGLLNSRKGLLGSRKGLLGSSGRQSLFGLPQKSRTKGLVLSIDLGIKALRDAILHAKVKQKNLKHRVQAQKNNKILHVIGKRNSHLLSTSDMAHDIQD